MIAFCQVVLCAKSAVHKQIREAMLCHEAVLIDICEEVSKKGWAVNLQIALVSSKNDTENLSSYCYFVSIFCFQFSTQGSCVDYK